MGYIPTSQETLPRGIAMRAEFPKYPVGTTEIKLILINETGTDFTYGSRYSVERYDPGKAKWYQVPFKNNVAFDAALHSISAHKTSEIIIYLSMLSVQPRVGKYRVWFLDDRSVCEFELTEDAVVPTTGSTAATAPATVQTTKSTTLSSSMKPDPVAGYLFVIDQLAEQKNLASLPFKYLAIDTTNLVDLIAEDKARLFKALEKYHLELLDRTFEQLKAEGYIVKTVFDKGVFVEMKNIRIQGNKMTMDAMIYLTGLNAYGMKKIDISFDGSSWQITRTEATWVA